MQPKKLPMIGHVATTLTLFLGALTGTGWAHDNADHRPSHQTHGIEDSRSAEVTVIERTLGDSPAETIVVSQSTMVRLVLHAPAGTQLHLHGYDLGGTATDTAPVIVTFHAYRAGRFPIEAHGVQDVLGRTYKALAYLEVRP